MSENLKTELLSQGVDYATTLERFMGKEELYKRFLIKFLADDNFNQLEEAIEDLEVLLEMVQEEDDDELVSELSEKFELAQKKMQEYQLSLLLYGK